jgi:hypothetical protein
MKFLLHLCVVNPNKAHGTPEKRARNEVRPGSARRSCEPYPPLPDKISGEYKKGTNLPCLRFNVFSGLDPLIGPEREFAHGQDLSGRIYTHLRPVHESPGSIKKLTINKPSIMKSNTTVINEVMQKIQLVEGKFTPSEANDVVTALINEKINFHKIQRLCIKEGNEAANCHYPNERIRELITEKRIAKDFIKEARRQGYDVHINGTLEITFEKK